MVFLKSHPQKSFEKHSIGGGGLAVFTDRERGDIQTKPHSSSCMIDPNSLRGGIKERRDRRGAFFRYLSAHVGELGCRMKYCLSEKSRRRTEGRIRKKIY